MWKLPAPLFQALFFTGVLVLITGGVQYQVARKQRTNFNNGIYIEDSRTGNSTRYRVLVSKDDTAGEYFTIEMLIRPQAYGAVRDKPGLQPAHYHIIQEEHIKVKEGRLGYYIGHHTHVKAAEEGDEVVVKPGEAHALFNAGGGSAGQDLLLEVTFRPARHGEAVFETLAGLGYDYDSPLAVSPLQKWLTMSRAEVVLTDIPPATWNFITSTVVPFAGKLGYKAFYPEYRTRREHQRSPPGAWLDQEDEDEEHHWQTMTDRMLHEDEQHSE